MNNKQLMVWLALAVVGTLFIACEDSEPPVLKGDTIIEATHLGDHSAVELEVVVGSSGFNLSSELFKYDVSVYKVLYQTTFNGNRIIASGIVALPKTSEPVGMLCFQHGTIVAHKDVPSEKSLLDGEMYLYAALASPGMIAVVPDYIGFGNSSNIFHPYYVEEAAARAVVDNAKAAKELATLNEINFTEKLFLAGYSQGGYATMAAHKYIEQEGLEGFRLIASFPAAGGYDIKAMQEYLFSLQTYPEPYYISYVVMAYKNTFNWKQPIGDFFNEPYATSIPDLFSGDLTGSEINSSLTTGISTLMNADLLTQIDSDAKYQFIVDALRENSLSDWTPSVQMIMYHGDADVTVPYENSIEVYDQFRENGVSEDVVQLITLSGANHQSGVEPYVEQFIPRLVDLNKK